MKKKIRQRNVLVMFKNSWEEHEESSKHIKSDILKEKAKMANFKTIHFDVSTASVNLLYTISISWWYHISLIFRKNKETNSTLYPLCGLFGCSYMSSFGSHHYNLPLPEMQVSGKDDVRFHNLKYFTRVSVSFYCFFLLIRYLLNQYGLNYIWYEQKEQFKEHLESVLLQYSDSGIRTL